MKEKQPFERLELTKEQLLEMFDYNQFKVRILNEKVTSPTTTVYRCGPLIDLCRGPHVRHTGKVKALKVTKVCYILNLVVEHSRTNICKEYYNIHNNIISKKCHRLFELKASSSALRDFLEYFFQ